MDVIRCLGTSLLISCVFISTLNAATLPEERLDVLHHAYHGGGMEINGPSVLVRKNYKEKISLKAHYYVDRVSSASVDVIANASPYSEERTEYGTGITYLNQKSLLGFNVTQSKENDYLSRSAHLSVSQDFFSDLTTLSLAFSRASDEIGMRGNPGFNERSLHYNYSLGLTQILTKFWLVSFTLEANTDEGLLRNPYRTVRYGSFDNFSFQPEQYPNTRTSDAYAVSSKYYLAHRAALGAEYRYFKDTWGIVANTLAASYTHTIKKNWILDFKYRYYQQDGADFYQDLFPHINAQTFLARDKEMSDFNSNSIGGGFSYREKLKNLEWLDDYAINFNLDYFLFDYDNFRDITDSSQPLYSYDAWVSRLYLTFWY